MEKSKLHIELIDWDSTCGDGCCTDYGTAIKLNGEDVEHYDEDQVVNAYVGSNVEVALKSVLKKLGFEVTIEHRFEEC